MVFVTNLVLENVFWVRKAGTIKCDLFIVFVQLEISSTDILGKEQRYIVAPDHKRWILFRTKIRIMTQSIIGTIVS